jgi:hypothetical protein
LPAYPAAALLAARWLALADRKAFLPAWVGWFPPGLFAALGVLFLLGGPIARTAGSERLGGLDPEAIGWRSLPAGIAFSLAALACIRALRMRSIARWAWSIWLGWAGAITALALFLYPLVNELKSARLVAEWLAARPEKPAAIPCLNVQPEGYRFYGGVPTVRDSDLAAALDREGAHFLGLANDLEYEALPPELRARMSVLHRAKVGSREVLVLGAASGTR